MPLALAPVGMVGLFARRGEVGLIDLLALYQKELAAAARGIEVSKAPVVADDIQESGRPQARSARQARCNRRSRWPRTSAR